jgi:hypothetical protein
MLGSIHGFSFLAYRPRTGADETSGATSKTWRFTSTCEIALVNFDLDAALEEDLRKQAEIMLGMTCKSD